MPFLKYRDNVSGLRPSSYPYILGRALNQNNINTSVIIYIINADLDFDHFYFTYIFSRKIIGQMLWPLVTMN